MVGFGDIRMVILDRLPSSTITTTTVTVTAAAAVAVLAFWWTTRKKSEKSQEISLDAQSVEIEPGVRASWKTPDGVLTEYYYSDARTIYESFLRGLRVSGNGPCLGSRTGPNKEFVWISYQQVLDRAHALGSQLIKLGLKPGSESKIGIFAQNRPEWSITQYASAMFSMVLVPLYDTLGKDACAYIANQTQMKLVVVDTMSKVKGLLEQASSIPSLKIIIVMDNITNNNAEEGNKAGIKILSFNDLLQSGKEDLQDVVPPRPDDPLTICYTSGTTGNPKGVILSHKNIISNIAAVQLFTQIDLTPEDSHLSYLPMAHMFEGVIQAMCYQHGMKIGFFRGDVKLLTEDLMALRPTIFPTVPRLLNRIYDKVMAGVRESKAKQMLFHVALQRKLALLEKGIITKTSVWDKLVFGKIQALLGGKVNHVITGSAPLADNVLQFIRCAFGCMVSEGYGQTEGTACLTFTLPHETGAGHVGPPAPCCLMKLVDVPDMNYFAKNNQGEVCSRGPSTMTEYYKEPEKTKEAIDEDGWLHTGDIGMWLPNGTLKIIDRKKHIFKLAQGEYLAPEKIETVYIRSSLVAQCFVDGNSLQICVVAIVVPDPEVVPGWAAKNGLKGRMEELCQTKELKEAIMSEMKAEAKKAQLKGFEQVKDIHLYPELFSVENGLLTPTFKSKRPALRQAFATQVEEMYSNLDSGK